MRLVAACYQFAQHCHVHTCRYNDGLGSEGGLTIDEQAYCVSESFAGLANGSIALSGKACADSELHLRAEGNDGG